MGKYPGDLGTDVYGLAIDELKVGVLRWTAAQAAALDADGILSEQATSTAVTTVTTFLAQPPQARLITVDPVDAVAEHVKASSTATIYGTNIAGHAITDVITFEANATAAGKTTKAFATVTKIVFSAMDGAAKFDVGWDDTLGLPLCLPETPLGIEVFNGALQTTLGTFTVDSDEVEKNTYNPNGTLDASKALNLYLLM